MIDYTMMKREGPKLQAALTRAKNSGDPAKVAAACERAVEVWREVGAWPDGWATWACAAEDALDRHRMDSHRRRYSDDYTDDDDGRDHATYRRLCDVIDELRLP